MNSTASNPNELEELKNADLGGRYNSEIVEIEGVISPKGGPCASTSSEQQVMWFILVAWRKLGRRLVNERLVVHQRLPQRAQPPRTYTALSIHRWNMLLAEDEKRAIVVSSASAPPDLSGLSEVVEKLSSVVSFQNDLFGAMTLDRRYDWFEGRAMWNDHPITVNLECSSDGSSPDEATLAIATSMWGDQPGWAQKVEACLIEKLLPIYNKIWRDDDAPELNATAFISRFCLDAIEIGTTGCYTFWFLNDEDLFGGHNAHVDGGVREDGTPFLSASF